VKPLLSTQNFKSARDTGKAEPRLPVVLVEDQISMRKALRRILDSTQAFDVEEFGSARDAIEYLKSHPVDLVVADIYLPKGNGIDILRYIRTRPIGNDIPVIFVTGEATKDDIVQAVDLGVTDYLIKPFEPGDLLAKMKLVVERFRHPSDRVKRLRDAESHFFIGELDAAIGIFRALLDEEPDSVRVLVSLAQAEARCGRADEALSLIDRAIRLSPIYFPAYAVATDILLAAGRKTEAVEQLTKELSIHGKQPGRRMLLADLYFDLSIPKDGLEQVRLALVDYPRDESVLLKMAELQFKSGDVEKSIYYYIKTRRKNPGCTKALDGIANVCVAVGDPQRAFKMFADAMKASPHQKDVLLSRARLHEKVGSYDPALGDVDTYLISEPENIEALLIRGRLLLRLSQSKEAQATWVEMESIAPTPENFAKIGIVCLKLNRFEMARSAYGKAVDRDPRNAKYHFSLGYALENLGQFGEALESYERVLELHPGDVEAQDARLRVSKKTRKAS